MAALPKISRLALGTAAFGMAYGLGNKGQAVSRVEVARILGLAWERGIDLLDTAAEYGEAESVIGGAKPKDAHFKIVSKIPRIAQEKITSGDVQRVRAAAHNSIQCLKIESFDTLLVHHAPDLLAPGGAELFRALQELKSRGITARLGVSVYDVDSLNQILATYPVEVVQLPLNLLDQRFIQSGAIANLAERKIEIHVRSVFLQGLLLTDPEKLSAPFLGLKEHLTFLRSEAVSRETTIQTIALAYISRRKEISRIIIGIQSADELNANISAFTNIPARLDLDFSAYEIRDPDVIDPRRWTR